MIGQISNYSKQLKSEKIFCPDEQKLLMRFPISNTQQWVMAVARDTSTDHPVCTI